MDARQQICHLSLARGVRATPSTSECNVNTLHSPYIHCKSQEVLYLARNNLKELHIGSISSISSLRVRQHHVMFQVVLQIFQVLYARHNQLRDSSIPSDVFKLEHLATLVSNSKFYHCVIVYMLTGFQP